MVYPTAQTQPEQLEEGCQHTCSDSTNWESVKSRDDSKSWTTTRRGPAELMPKVPRRGKVTIPLEHRSSFPRQDPISFSFVSWNNPQYARSKMPLYQLEYRGPPPKKMRWVRGGNAGTTGICYRDIVIEAKNDAGAVMKARLLAGPNGEIIQLSKLIISSRLRPHR